MPSTDEGRQSFSKGQGHWLPRWLLQPPISLFSLTSPILQLSASSLILAGHFLSSFLILPLLFFFLLFGLSSLSTCPSMSTSKLPWKLSTNHTELPFSLALSP